MKYRILLLFSVLTFGLFFPKANNSALAQSNEDFATTVYKTREEVRDITYELKNTLSDRKKLLLKMNTLTNDIDKVLLKFKNQQIKDFNNEIRNIYKRIKTVRDKGLDSEDKIDDLNKRKAVIDCQLHENSGLQDLVYTNDLYKAVNEFNTFDRELNKKSDIYFNKRDAFMSKVKTLPSVRKIQKEADGVTKEWGTLLQEANELMEEMNGLTNDMDKVIQKINNRQITDCNDEIRDVGSRTNTFIGKRKKIQEMRNSLVGREEEISEDPKKVLSFIDCTDHNKMIEEWNAFDEEWGTNWNNYRDKAKIFVSKVKLFPCIRRYQDEVDKITEEWKTVLSDMKKLMPETDALINDIDEAIVKIDKHEITDCNNEIKDINSRLCSFHDKIDSIDIANRKTKINNILFEIRRDPLLKRTKNNAQSEEGDDEIITMFSEEETPEIDPLVWLINWEECKKVYNEDIFLTVFVNKEYDSKKLKTLWNKIDILKSKTKDFPAVRKLQNEVSDMASRGKTLLSDEKKLLSEMDLLIRDIDGIFGKIDRKEITDCNNEIEDINSRVNSLYNKTDDISNSVKEFNRIRKEIRETLGVVGVDWTDYNKVLDEWHALMSEEDDPKWKIFEEKLDSLENKVKTFSSVRKLQDEVVYITYGWQILLSDKKDLLPEIDPLINDINRAMEKIDRREIKKYNKEIKNIYNRINSLNEKNDDISSRKDDLNNREDAVRKTSKMVENLVENLVDWTDFNKVIDKWNTFRDEEDIPKWDIYNKKVETFNSITANLSNHP
ncbi:hypothetical protein [Candidatus Azobacteroides pseudotrichonymphae]|uniref:Uncharacterized protein n=1 Tax=Azobacteroides pseudotrichonymphae genomovar. CFP2 TaxID=511995 RepID=B6YS67_AZOPC|nr:hypothetical protein [Candidatus Azobacteroides pseudotrichonymphae]BAG84039.1 hypothetical protein CFPG_P1-18 [Candidatus Azobacteroides pseudotrichonymphae genomovar. CFP2]